MRTGCPELRFRTGCPGLCVLRFKYLAAPTKRTVITATGTGPTHHCLQRASGSILPLSPYLKYVFVKSLPTCLTCLTSLCEDCCLFGFILSSILIHITYLLVVFVLSLHCLLDYGLSSVVYLPLHLNSVVYIVCLRNSMF